MSGLAQGNKPKGTKRAQTEILADFRRFLRILASSFGRRLMHHQNVSVQNGASKRTFLTFYIWGGPAILSSLMSSKEYVLMVPVAMVRFDGASGACQLPRKQSIWEMQQIFAENRRFSQETAESGRNPQKTVDWRLSP